MVVTSCSDDDDTINISTDIVGKWLLVEQLVDPGDGSGTFQPVDSDFTLEFFNNGTIVSTNGSLCDVFTSSNDTSSGTFSLENTTLNIGCEDDVITIFFEKNEAELILNFICIEACAQKFRKL
ncbi:hypothetical protein GCM10022259_34920 [Aquimarina mytili]